MELRYLRYFIAVAEDLSFSRAAERLHVDQSALSRRIQDLEYELRVRLFTRTQHRVQLTAAGAAFLEEARRLMADTEVAIETARRAARGEVGRLNIGYIGALSDGLIPRLLRQYRARYPEVTENLKNMRGAQQIAALLSRQIDVGFVGQPNSEYELHLIFEVFREDPMEVVLPAGHPLLARKQIRLANLAREKFVLLTRAGNPISGYAVTNCTAITANSTSNTVTWTGGSSVSSLAGTTVKLRFEMTNTKLYAIQFVTP